MTLDFIRRLPLNRYILLSCIIIGILCVMTIVIVSIIRDVHRTNLMMRKDKREKTEFADTIIGIAFIILGIAIAVCVMTMTFIQIPLAIAVGDQWITKLSEPMAISVLCMIGAFLTSTVTWEPFEEAHVQLVYWILAIILFAFQIICDVVVHFVVTWG